MKLFLILAILSTTLCFAQESPNKAYIPVEKNLDKTWVESLSQKGELKVYKGDELKWIGMPCGGIGAGQVYITGDGELCFFESIYNQQQKPNAGFGLSNGYQYMNPQERKSKIESSFSVSIKEEGKEADNYSLSSKSFDAMEFIGEYPLAKIKFNKSDENLPVEIRAEVFSPFVPLSVRSSANPVIVLKYELTNISSNPLEVSITGTLKNIAFPIAEKIEYENSVFQDKGVGGVAFEMNLLKPDSAILKHPKLGGLSLAVLDEKAQLLTNKDDKNKNTFSSKEPIAGKVASIVKLKPNQTKEITFLVSWYFPNYYENGRRYPQASKEAPGWVGHIYNNWYSNSSDVAKYIAANFIDLYDNTKLFRDTYNDNTLPYWLSNRITMPVSTLAAGNVAIWQNGRFYSYEGVGFCMGTCGHVYNFVTTVSKLFPELERSVRLLQDFNDSVAFSPSGRINFRGYGANDPHAIHSYASDAQSGYVLKAYREHLMSTDNEFLESIWEQVKLAIGYHIFKDGAEIGLEPNGVLEGEQTFWDPMWYGPNPYNNTLYLAALRAAEEMALVMGENDLAKRYRQIFESGQKYMNEKMWNGEFYSHLLPAGFKGNVGIRNGFQKPEEIENNAIGFNKAFMANKPNYFMSKSCDANQLFGQNWAHQLGLGNILPPENCLTVAKNIFKTCWTPDIATVYNYKTPHSRILAEAGEGAMINGSIPEGGPAEFENNHDKTDIWTGLEYEAACDMINAGLIDEPLIMLKSIHDRYDGSKRNPWNEIEGSDHYSRAMHSWNILLTLSGFTYNGPYGKIGFAPKISPENFKSFFSAAEGWGSFEQVQSNKEQSCSITLAYGKLGLNELVLVVPKTKTVKKIKVKHAENSVNANFVQEGTIVKVKISSQIELNIKDKLSIQLSY